MLKNLRHHEQPRNPLHSVADMVLTADEEPSSEALLQALSPIAAQEDRDLRTTASELVDLIEWPTATTSWPRLLAVVIIAAVVSTATSIVVTALLLSLRHF